MRNLFYSLLIVLCLTVPMTYAAEDLESWTNEPYQGTTTFTPSGTSVTTSASAGQDDYAWAQLYNSYPRSNGASATFSIDTVSNESDASVSFGLRRYLGINSSGNVLLAEVYLNCWQGDYRVMYRIRERLQDGTTVRDLARGWLGGTSGTFILGEDVTIGLAKIGCDTVFYCSAVPGLTRVSNCDFENYPADYSNNIGIYTYTEPNSDMTGTASNVNIAYSASDVETLFGGTTIKSYESGYKDSLSQASAKPEQPVILSPSGSGSQNGTFYWNTVFNATWYKVWIEDSTGTAVVKKWYEAAGTDTNAGYSFITDDTLVPGDYKWWIKAWNSNGGIWSDEANFTIAE